jgi:hypothetical protein
MAGIEAFTEHVKRDFVAQPRDSAMRRSADVAERIGMGLDAAMKEGNVTTVLLLLDRLLDERTTPLVVFRKLAGMWGGETAFTARVERFLAEHPDSRADMIGLMSGKGTVAMRIRYRMNGDQPTPGGFDPAEFAALVKELSPVVKTIPLAMAAGPMGPSILAGSAFVHVIKPHFDEVLATAKKFWDDYATSLVEEEGLGNVLLATTVQSLNDIFVPGSTIEAAISLLPVGRLGVLIKAVLLKAAALVGLRLAASGLKRLGILVFRLVKDMVQTHIGSRLLPFENLLAEQMISTADTRARKALIARVHKFLQVANQWFSFETKVDDIIEQGLKKKGPKTLTKAAMKEIEDELVAIFPVPPGSPATLSFKCLPDGTVVQEVNTVLSTNSVGRTLEDLASLAEKFDLYARPNEHWAHIAANRLSGDDALYNLIRADERVNVSFMKEFDNLAAGTAIRVRIVFKDFTETLSRNTAALEYVDTNTGQMIGTLTNVLARPPKTMSQIKQEAFELAQKVGLLGSDKATNQLVAQLAEFFDL